MVMKLSNWLKLIYSSESYLTSQQINRKWIFYTPKIFLLFLFGAVEYLHKLEVRFSPSHNFFLQFFSLQRVILEDRKAFKTISELYSARNAWRSFYVFAGEIFSSPTSCRKRTAESSQFIVKHRIVQELRGAPCAIFFHRHVNLLDISNKKLKKIFLLFFRYLGGNDELKKRKKRKKKL